MLDQEIINFANHLADLSSEVIRKYFRQDFGEIKKNDQSPVTIADKEAEEVMRNAIIKQFPNHGIVGEEFGNINPDAKYQWVLDPIDGTVSFVIGRPIFGTLIALCFEGKPILGIINQPINNERWVGSPYLGGTSLRQQTMGAESSPLFRGESGWASDSENRARGVESSPLFRGESGWASDSENRARGVNKSTLNNQKIQTRKCANLNEAILCTTSPFFFQGKDLEMLNKISSQTKYQSQGGTIYGGDCYLYGLLAMGQIDIVIERGLKNFDFMALAPIIKAAGGVITDWRGNELNLHSDGTILACGDKVLHQKILGMIN